MSKTISIHQPNLMPWLGFFIKIWRSDIFIILDHTTNNIKDSQWFRRVNINISGKKSWLSLPIEKSDKGTFQRLREMKIRSDLSSQKLFRKYIKSIEQTYSNCDYFDKYKYLINDYFNNSDYSLLNRNMNFISEILRVLKIDTEIKYSSSLYTSGSSNDLLIGLVKSVGGNIYLYGTGAVGYQDNKKFLSNGIKVVENNCYLIEYKQHNMGTFIDNLSILDIIFNIGPQKTEKYIKKFEKITNIKNIMQTFK